MERNFEDMVNNRAALAATLLYLSYKLQFSYKLGFSSDEVYVDQVSRMHIHACSTIGAHIIIFEGVTDLT